MASSEPTGRNRVLVFAGTAVALFLIGALLINQLWNAVAARAGISPERRRPVSTPAPPRWASG